MRAEIIINDRKIGKKHEPFIIAEISGNHNQSLERAISIVEAASQSGAHAVKLQTYTADTMTLNVDNDEFKILDPDSLWYGYHLYELYQKAHTPWEWHEPIMKRANELGLICFSTPFDETAVDFLENLNVPVYKIASFENTDIKLIKKVCQTGKPVIISTGMASLKDLQLVVSILRENDCDKFVLLKCTSAYPALPSDANLLTIPHMAEMFHCQVGLSDHTMGIGVAITAVALGATVIEKHFTLSRAEGGIDSDFSLEPLELKLLVEESKKAWEALGEVNYVTGCAEEKSKNFRRSIYFVKNMQAGDIITENSIRNIRPGFGLHPKNFYKILGRKLTRDVKIGNKVLWEHIE